MVFNFQCLGVKVKFRLVVVAGLRGYLINYLQFALKKKKECNDYLQFEMKLEVDYSI